MAEKVGFEPTDGVNRQTISSRSRYDRFDTSPDVFQQLTNFKDLHKNHGLQIFGNFFWKLLKTLIFNFIKNPVFMRF